MRYSSRAVLAVSYCWAALLLLLATTTNAFSVRDGRHHPPTAVPFVRARTRLFDLPPETTVQVTDVEEAIEALQEADMFEPPEVEPSGSEDEDVVIITIENELTEPPIDVDRETLTGEIQQVLLENETTHSPDVAAVSAASMSATTTTNPDASVVSVDQPEPPAVDERPQQQDRSSRLGRGLASDIFGRFRRAIRRPEHTVEEAAVSASLYMNPATAKIASNLIITWEPTVAELLSHMNRVSNPNRPLMVGIVGIPGSGKSTSAEILAALLSSTDAEKEAIVMPMDGFHLPLETLGQMDNAPDLIYRRGAPDTFDPQGLAVALERIQSGSETSVTIPGFDHAKGDPVPDQHTFDRSRHNIVLCEGIYLLHDNDGWENIKSFFDWTIYIDADVDACIERLKERNKCIPVS
jgi:uridine kinase